MQENADILRGPALSPRNLKSPPMRTEGVRARGVILQICGGAKSMQGIRGELCHFVSRKGGGGGRR